MPAPTRSPNHLRKRKRATATRLVFNLAPAVHRGGGVNGTKKEKARAEAKVRAAATKEEVKAEQKALGLGLFDRRSTKRSEY
jgi:hypothetical protein